MGLSTQNINEKGKQKIVTKYNKLESGTMTQIRQQGVLPLPVVLV